MTTAIVSPLLGGSLLALLLVDVLLTVFHPQGHGGPLHRWQNRFLWAVLKRFGHSKAGRDRPRFMALCGPVIAVSSVASWGLWLIVGYALIYYPFRGAFKSAVGDGIPSVDALYYSGYVASTLGLGDIIPVAPGLRLLTVLEAMSGFALFAVATTYLLAVYQQVAHENVLALELSSLAAEEPQEVWTEWNENDASGFRVWCDSTARSLLRVVHAHGQYPVLHYFRPADPDRALLVQIRHMLDLVHSADRAPRSKDASFRLLRVALRRYLVELNRGCLPTDRDLPPGSGDRDLNELYGRLAHYMCYPSARSDPNEIGAQE